MSFIFFFSIFSSGGHCVQPGGPILAIFVKGYKRNISVKYYEIRQLAAKMSLKVFFFLFLALVAIVFSRVEPF